jgi:hypothetical protein
LKPRTEPITPSRRRSPVRFRSVSPPFLFGLCPVLVPFLFRFCSAAVGPELVRAIPLLLGARSAAGPDRVVPLSCGGGGGSRRTAFARGAARSGAPGSHRCTRGRPTRPGRWAAPPEAIRGGVQSFPHLPAVWWGKVAISKTYPSLGIAPASIPRGFSSRHRIKGSNHPSGWS